MSDDLSLFGNDAPKAPEVGTPTVQPIANWQVDLIRKILDARGLTAMDDRKAAIELAAGRVVESLRALTHDEALKVLSKLGQTGVKTDTSRSAWDEREEGTWIDRL